MTTATPIQPVVTPGSNVTPLVTTKPVLNPAPAPVSVSIGQRMAACPEGICHPISPTTCWVTGVRKGAIEPLTYALSRGFSRIFVFTVKGLMEYNLLSVSPAGKPRLVVLPAKKLPGTSVPLSADIVQKLDFLPAGKIPHKFYRQIIQFFKDVVTHRRVMSEAMIWVLWDPARLEDNGYFLCVPTQQVSSASATYSWNDVPSSAMVVVDIHSHGSMGAFYSGTDNTDDAGSIRYSGVIGKIESPTQDRVMRFCNDSASVEAKWEDVFEQSPNLILPTDFELRAWAKAAAEAVDGQAVTQSPTLQRAKAYLDSLSAKEDAVTTPPEWLEKVTGKGDYAYTYSTGGLGTYPGTRYYGGRRYGQGAGENWVTGTHTPGLGGRDRNRHSFTDGPQGSGFPFGVEGQGNAGSGRGRGKKQKKASSWEEFVAKEPKREDFPTLEAFNKASDEYWDSEEAMAAWSGLRSGGLDEQGEDTESAMNQGYQTRNAYQMYPGEISTYVLDVTGAASIKVSHEGVPGDIEASIKTHGGAAAIAMAVIGAAIADLDSSQLSDTIKDLFDILNDDDAKLLLFRALYRSMSRESQEQLQTTGL